LRRTSSEASYCHFPRAHPLRDRSRYPIVNLIGRKLFEYVCHPNGILLVQFDGGEITFPPGLGWAAAPGLEDRNPVVATVNGDVS
jgi:hypothetical protein